MIKAIIDFLSGLFKFKFIQELPLLFFKPRYFFSVIENESTAFTFKRILFYILTYNFIFILIRTYLGLSNNENLNTEYLSLTILDLASLALFFSPFLILIKFTSPKIGIKTIITYLICVHLNFLLFYFIFYGLFISTENYIFAILRAISVYSIIPILILGYPIIFSFTLKNRLKLIIISLLLYLLISIVRYEIDQRFTPNWEISIYSLFRDPIGEEGLEVAKFAYSNLSKNISIPNSDSLIVLFSKYHLNTLDSIGMNPSKFVLIRDSLYSLRKELKYNTSIKFLSLGINALNKLISTSELMRNYIDTVSFIDSNICPVTKFDSTLKANEMKIDSVKSIYNIPPDSSIFSPNVVKYQTLELKDLIKISLLYEESAKIYQAYTRIRENLNNIWEEFIAYQKLLSIFQDEYSAFLSLKTYLSSYYIIAPKPY